MKRCMLSMAAIAAVFAAAALETRGADRPRAGQKHLQVKDLSPVKPLPAASHAPLVLVKDGRPQAVIQVNVDKPGGQLEILVRELVTVIEQLTGATLPVLAGQPAPPNVAAVVIGDCIESRQAGIDAARLPIEGFEIKTVANRIFLVGSTRPLEPGASANARNDGTAWAVSDFMERLVGVRWYWPVTVGGRSLPPVEDPRAKRAPASRQRPPSKRTPAAAAERRAGTLAIEPSHYADAPVFRWRQYYPGKRLKPDAWVARTGEGGGSRGALGRRALPGSRRHGRGARPRPCRRTSRRSIFPSSWPACEPATAGRTRSTATSPGSCGGTIRS